MADKKSFLLYLDQYPPIKSLTLEQKGMLLDAFFAFNMGEEVSFDDPVVAMAFAFFRQAFERDKGKYQETSDKNRENGRLGGRPKKADASSENPKNPPLFSEPKKADNDNDSDILREHPDGCLSPAEEPADSPQGGGNDFPDCPHQRVIELYHEILPELPRVRTWEGQRKKHLAARWKETLARLKKAGKNYDLAAGIDWWRKFFEHVRRCPLLMGKVPRSGKPPWNANLPWLVLPENYAKTLENHYLDRRPAA